MTLHFLKFWHRWSKSVFHEKTVDQYGFDKYIRQCETCGIWQTLLFFGDPEMDICMYSFDAPEEVINKNMPPEPPREMGRFYG